MRDAVCIEQPSISLRAELTAHGSVRLKHLLIRVRLRAIPLFEVEIAKPNCASVRVTRVRLRDVREQIRKVPLTVAVSARGGVREHDQQRQPAVHVDVGDERMTGTIIINVLDGGGCEAVGD